MRKSWHHECPSCHLVYGHAADYCSECSRGQTLSNRAYPANISMYVCRTSNAANVYIAHKPTQLHNILCISHYNNNWPASVKAIPERVLVCRRHIPLLLAGLAEKWEALQRKGGTAKENSQRGLRRTRLESRAPFCHGTLLVPQGPYGRLSLCTLTSAHSSPSSTPFAPWQDRPCEWVMARVKSTPVHFC